MTWLPPLTLPAGAGESGRGFLARLALRNAERDVGRFARHLGLDADGVRRGHGIAELERAARLPPGTLRCWSPVVDPATRTLVLHGEVLRSQDWDATTRRWCPACLADDLARPRPPGRHAERLSYHRAWWDFLPVDRCPAHGVDLLSRCPRCQATQTVDVRNLTRCACSASLADPCVGEPDEASRYLHDRLWRLAGTEVALLDGLALSEVVPFLDRLGLAALSEPGIGWARLRGRPVRACRSAGMTVALGWPAAFEAVLDRAVSAAVARGSSGMLGTYGWIHEHWINPMPGTGAGAALKAVLRSHAVRHGVVADGEALLGADRREGTIDLAAASRLLGVAHPRATRLLGQRSLLPRGRRRGVGAVLDASTVEAVASQRRRRLDLEGVRGRLGIGRSQARAVASTFLRVGGQASLPDGADSSGYDLDDMLRLTSRLRAVAVPVDEVPEALLPLPRACQSAGVPLEVAIKAILEGTVGAVSRGMDAAECMPSLFVSPDALRTLRSKPTTLSLSEVAPLLRIHPEAVLELARHGAIPAHRDRARWTFEREDAERFAAEHVPASVVARELGTSPRKVLHDLLDRGIRPAFGPPKFRQALLARSDLGRVNLPMFSGFTKHGNSKVA